MMTKNQILKEQMIQQNITDIVLRFKLRLNVERRGDYKKGDEDYFYIKLLDEQNGLVRYPIDKCWDIISCEVVNGIKQ